MALTYPLVWMNARTRPQSAPTPAAVGPSTPALATQASSTQALPPAAGPSRFGPVALVVAAGISVQFGAALAVMVMPRAGAAGVVTLRLAAAALVLLVLCRPKVRGYSRADWGTVVAFGVAMAGMNGLFYQSIDRIPLGPAVTLEVLGPLVLSVVVSRRLVNLLWAAWPWPVSPCWPATAAAAASAASTSWARPSRSERA